MCQTTNCACTLANEAQGCGGNGGIHHHHSAFTNAATGAWQRQKRFSPIVNLDTSVHMVFTSTGGRLGSFSLLVYLFRCRYASSVVLKDSDNTSKYEKTWKSRYIFYSCRNGCRKIPVDYTEVAWSEVAPPLAPLLTKCIVHTSQLPPCCILVSIWYSLFFILIINWTENRFKKYKEIRRIFGQKAI